MLESGSGVAAVAVPGHAEGVSALRLLGPRMLFTGDAVADVGHSTPGVFPTDRDRAVELLHGPAEPAIGTVAFERGDPMTRRQPSSGPPRAATTSNTDASEILTEHGGTTLSLRLRG